MAQALRGYTREAAYAGRVERQRGAIMPGMQADFAVFDRDLFRIDPETIPRSRCCAPWWAANSASGRAERHYPASSLRA
jgi:predicted amidohydrolase YtcJ